MFIIQEIKQSVKIGSGITPTGGSRIYKTEGRPFLRSQNIGWGTLSLDDVAYIDDIIHDTFKSTEIKEGDVFLNITGASIGRSAIADHRVVNGNVNQHVCIIRPIEEELNSYFLNCFLLSHKGQKQIDSFQSGGNRQGLNYGQIKLFKIPLPPLTEQKAIAQSLSDVDNLITAIDKLITKKRNIKQGTIQELLTGKKRLPGFSGEWEVKKLGDIGKFKKGKNLPKKSITQDGQPCVLYGEIYTKYNYYSKVLYSRISYDLAKESIEINTGDILFAGSGETFEEIGKCFAYLGIEKAYAGGDIIILSPNKDDSYFLSYLLNSYQANVQKSNLGQGSSVIHIYTINLKNIEIPIPPLPEQKAIAKILTEMDEEIEALEKKREKYKNIKQGMMQELLTGKTRIIDN